MGSWCSWDRTGATPMFGKLKDLFGPKNKKKANTPAKPAKSAKVTPAKLKRVNIERRFTIIAETGRAACPVYKALDKEAGRTVCLKVQDLAKATAAAARAAKEGRPTEGEIGKRIVHPHVVRTYEYGA